jgi:hypothetical protein
VAENGLVTAEHGGSEVGRWRLAAPLASLLVLGTGAFAALYPTYSPVVTGILVGWLGLLLAWALSLVLTSGWQLHRRRVAYSATVVGSFAAFGVVLAWRALGGGVGLGAALAALFCADVLVGLAFRRPLSRVFGWRGGDGAARVLGVSAVTAGLVLFLVIRLAPVWFAQHLLLPAMLLVALIAASGGRTFR